MRTVVQRIYASSLTYGLTGLLALGALAVPAQEPPNFGPNREWTSINTGLYELSVQQNGRVDVRLRNSLAVLENAIPTMLEAGEDDARPLTIEGKHSGRLPVNTQLGEGQGFALGNEERQWILSAYPTQPFFTLELVYTNTGRNPITIERLTPWSQTRDTRATVWAGSDAAEAPVLDNGNVFGGFNDYARVRRGGGGGNYNLALHNPASGYSLIVGFLSHDRAYTEVELERTERAEDEFFDRLVADCVYDPPVTLQPGESLRSEVLYIAVAEGDPVHGLARYGRAYALWNQVPDPPAFVPHGWDSWSTHHHRAIDEPTLLAELAVLREHLTRYGWKHFAIDAGWARARGDWTPDPAKFPNGLGPVVEAIHDAGMTAGLWIDPFTVDVDSELAAQHPDWLRPPNDRGRLLLGEGARILDVSRPDAYQWVYDLARRIRQEWGFDALVEADFVYHLLLAEDYSDATLTRVEVLQLGMQALREGLGEGAFLMSMTPHPITGRYADGVRTGRDNAPIWQGNALTGPWGARESLTNAVRRFYLSPHVFLPDQDVAFFAHDPTRARWNVQDRPALSMAQSVAWLTGAALTGGAVKIGDAFSLLTPEQRAVLQKLLPSARRPARPLDLFDTDAPRLWHVPFETEAGTWHIVAAFNWDDGRGDTVLLPFERLGVLDRDYFTVYDFWEARYLGTARGRLRIETQPGGVTLLGLRPYVDRPQFVASNRHWAQGAMELRTAAWEAAAGTWRGTFEATPNHAYDLRFLAPAGWRVLGATWAGQEAAAVQQGREVHVQAASGAGGQAEVVVRFARE